MKNKVVISVLMAMYNTHFYLVKRAIDSVLNQHFEDFEIIVIDDGSENDTLNDLMQYYTHQQHKISFFKYK